MVQAALTGQGVVLARLPLVAESLANGDLVEPLPGLRMDSPKAYWLIAVRAAPSARRSRRSPSGWWRRARPRAGPSAKRHRPPRPTE